jgi:hypothetical protein
VRCAAPAPVDGAGGSIVLSSARAVLAVVSGVMIFTRWTRRKGVPIAGFLGAPSTAMGTALQAQEDEARELARRQILELGERLGHSAIQPTGAPAALVQRALDAYEAAERVLDRAHDITDIAGALVLARQGRDALGAAAAVARGKKPPATVPLCFFNPLHGISAWQIAWRPPGQSRAITVRSCDQCARRVKQRRPPDALPCRKHGHDVPYYEADPKHSVWAATGYGQFCHDLIERVLAGHPPPHGHRS